MTTSQRKIEELKDKLAEHKISMIEFHSACHSTYSGDDYETFLHKLHKKKIWNRPMQLGFELLEEVVLG